MRQILFAAAGAALLAYAPTASAQMDTSADAYRRMNDEPVVSYGASGSVTTSYGASGAVTTTAGGRDTTDSGWFGGLSFISPNDPEYSYTAPPHRGQPMTWELN